LYRIRSNIYCRIDGDVLCRMGISWEYASMMTDKQHNAQLEEADALEIQIETLANHIDMQLKSQKFVVDYKGNQIHIEDFTSDVEVNNQYMAELISGNGYSFQEDMQQKLYEFSLQIATEIIEAGKS